MSREAEQVESPFVVFHVDTYDMFPLAKHFSYVRSFTRNTQEGEGARIRRVAEMVKLSTPKPTCRVHTRRISLRVAYLLDFCLNQFGSTGVATSLSSHTTIYSAKKKRPIYWLFFPFLLCYISLHEDSLEICLCEIIFVAFVAAFARLPNWQPRFQQTTHSRASQISVHGQKKTRPTNKENFHFVLVVEWNSKR